MSSDKEHMAQRIIVYGFFFVFAAAAANAEPAYLMGAMGDSITAATFADSTAHPAEAGRAGPSPIMNWGVLLPFLGHTQNKKTLSWASGTSIQSHYSRLSTLLSAQGAELTVLNVAVPGDITSGMLSQAQQIHKAMDSGSYEALRYVTFFIGNNDVCSGRDVATMEQEIMVAFAELASISQGEPIRMLLVGIPQIPNLGKPEIKNMTAAAGRTCEDVRDNFLKECSLTQWQTEAEYADGMKKVEDVNTMLARVAGSAKGQFPTLDVHFTAKVTTTTIDPHWMAADCFHPNESGHTEIAARLWEEQPWFGK